MKKVRQSILGLIILFGSFQWITAQPDIFWDIELDVSIPFNVEGNIEAMRAHYGEYVPINIELKNCGPRLYDYGLLLITVDIKLTVQGLELPSSDNHFGPANWWYGSDEQMVRFGAVATYCPNNFDFLEGPTIMAKVIDYENAYLMAEIVEYHHNGHYGLDRSPASYEVDNQPNNGVDTDSDGDFSNDPDDEDDGDGLYLTDINTRKPISCTCEWESNEDTPMANPEVVGESAENSSGGSVGVPSSSPTGGSTTPPLPGTTGTGSGGTISATGGCMIAADVPSPFPANPEEPNAILRFDYFIESIARIGYIETDGTIVNQELKMNYHVNSNDGSMFFATGQEGFFAANALPTATRTLENHGVVWKADGQRITYGLDRTSNILRAAVVEQDQTSTDVAGQKRLNVREFINSMGTMGRSPDPLPAHLAAKWGDVPGYIGNMNDVGGTKSTVTIYMGRSPDINPIATNSPLVGFMVGVFKDHLQANCNKLAVYTRMTMGSPGDFIEVELKDIQPISFEFDGRPYSVTPISGASGTNYKDRMQELEREAVALGMRQLDLDAERRRDCAGDDLPCNDRYKAEIEHLQVQIDDLQCQALCLAGMQSAMENCRCR